MGFQTFSFLLFWVATMILKDEIFLNSFFVTTSEKALCAEYETIIMFLARSQLGQV